MDPIQFISTGNHGNEFVLNDEVVKILEKENRYEILLLQIMFTLISNK